MSANLLKNEKSPYLLQHQNNPVHWYAWGDAAFQAAQAQNRPIFLSIGYSTCHWCHVMAHESFEDQEVADVLNRDFISIKVDREERPDVDEIYMSAVHAMRQRGGWPLSMFLTPDLKPFYGGTYWPRPVFLGILDQVAKVWREQRGEIEKSGESIVEYLRAQKSAILETRSLDVSVFQKFFLQTQQSFDAVWGGFGPAPKFPHAMQISLLLRVHRRSGEPRALEMARFTLEKMARGGIYDHVGGGFARYSTDEKWLVPHFEKMLYDNAQLAATYLEAFRATKEEMFRRVAAETLDYVLRAMTHPEGGFYSAEDADSEGEEGKFYVWTFEELSEALTQPELEHWIRVYQISPAGNFEHGANIFSLSDEFSWQEKDHPLIRSAREKLFQLREARIHPHKDDKILSAWNGLMIRAMALGYQVLGEEKYLEAAHRAAQFIRKNLFSDSHLQARYREGEGRFAARLEDYAYLIQGLIDLYQCDFNPEPLRWALELQEVQYRLFWDKDASAFFFTDGKDPSLLLRSKEGMDGALPNANAVSAWNLLRLQGLTYDLRYGEWAQGIFSCFSAVMSEYPTAFSTLLIAYDYFSDLSAEIAVLCAAEKSDLEASLQKIRAEFFPNQVLALGKGGQDFPLLLSGKTALENKIIYYLCRDQSCEAPLQEAQKLLEKLREFREYRLD
ncbi:MAG TPA: thioredoxin domain-containing protein [Deltaproteobacteria bacterium]|nr:thioredoxin domain-containing protein [Deltaproteobacteria bacterium]